MASGLVFQPSGSWSDMIYKVCWPKWYWPHSSGAIWSRKWGPNTICPSVPKGPLWCVPPSDLCAWVYWQLNTIICAIQFLCITIAGVTIADIGSTGTWKKKKKAWSMDETWPTGANLNHPWMKHDQPGLNLNQCCAEPLNGRIYICLSTYMKS